MTRPAAQYARPQLIRAALTLLWFVVFPVTSPALADPPDDESRTAIIGSLIHTRVDVELNDCPARQAFDMLGSAIGWTIDDMRPEPAAADGKTKVDLPVTVHARDITAVFALEIMIAEIATDDPITWQIDDGSIIVGSRYALSARRNLEQRVYDINDLAVKAPYFQSPTVFGKARAAPDTASFNRHHYRPAALVDGPLGALKHDDNSFSIGQTKGQLVRGLIRGFVDLVEPGNWDYGDELEDILPDPKRYQPLGDAVNATRAARVRIFNETSVAVTAPDFIHRELGGYPKPTLPSREFVDKITAQPPTGTPSNYVRFARIRRDDGTDDSPGLSDPGDSIFLTNLKSSDQARLRLADAIRKRRISVSFDNTPANEALAQWSRLAGIPIMVRSDDDPQVQPAVDVSMKNTSALTILEAMLKDCSKLVEQWTWQIRPGYVEVGPKRRLSVTAARDLRVYPIRNLMMVIPKRPLARRQIPEIGALNFVQTVVSSIEPEAWDWGQDLGEPPYPTGNDVTTTIDVNTSDAGSAPPIVYVEHSKPAIIRYYGDAVIVVAPDYIHRQLAGYHPQLK